MSNIVIKVENLGKKYLIKHEQKESYQTFQDMIINGSRNLVTSLNPFQKKDYRNDKSIEEFWVLDDINY